MTEVESSVELPASSAAIVCRSIMYRGQQASRGLHPSRAQFDHYRHVVAHISGGRAPVAIWISQCRRCVNCDGGEKLHVGLRKPFKTKSLVFERKQLPTAVESAVNSVPVQCKICSAAFLEVIFLDIGSKQMSQPDLNYTHIIRDCFHFAFICCTNQCSDLAFKLRTGESRCNMKNMLISLQNTGVPPSRTTNGLHNSYVSMFWTVKPLWFHVRPLELGVSTERNTMSCLDNLHRLVG